MKNTQFEKRLRIALATVRFDKVPETVTSRCLERSPARQEGDVLDHEYDIRRYLDIASFVRKLKSDLAGWLGDEIRRLYELGLHPVLYIGFFSYDLDFFNVRIGEETIDRLARQGRSIRFVFDSEEGNKERIVIEIPRELISTMAEFHFTLELS